MSDQSGATIMAIDPGFTGAIALYDSETGELSVTDMPVIAASGGKRQQLDMANLLATIERSVALCDACVVESVAGMPKQSGQFRFGYVAGAIDMAATAANANLVKWTPQVWKARAGLATGAGTDRKMRKMASRMRAMILFPEYKHLFERVKDDGRAEAALIAWAYAQWSKIQRRAA